MLLVFTLVIQLFTWINDTYFIHDSEAPLPKSYQGVYSMKLLILELHSILIITILELSPSQFFIVMGSYPHPRHSRRKVLDYTKPQVTVNILRNLQI